MTRDYLIDVLSRGVASGAAKALVGFPFAVLYIRCAVYLGIAEWAGMARPDMRQTVVIAAAIVILS